MAFDVVEESQRFDGARALVVDDDPAIVHLLRRFLEQHGFVADTAAHGPEALAALASRPVDLVITDLAMPGMTGIELIREARARGIDAEFVVLTAVGSVPSAVEAMKCGAFEFLEKPVRFDHLRKVVANAMRHRRDAAVRVDSADVVAAGPVSPPPAAPAAGTPPPAASPPPQQPPPLPVGEAGQTCFPRIGRYDVLSLIGRGGMGEVFRCRDTLIGRVVAVKVMRLATDRPGRSAELLVRFQREAAAAGALQHPGIVAVYDLGHDNALGLWFIVLELVEGRSLDNILDEHHHLAAPEAVAIAFQVADALAFAHARGVVHRDVKPANVLVRQDGSTKLLDFGLAAMQGSDITLQGQILGSPAYMAPERIRGNAAGPASDQFSLGVLLYETLSGSNPYDGETQEARLVRVLEHRPPRVEHLAPDVPRDLGALVERLMARKPVDRFPTTDEVVAELGRIGKRLGLRLRRYEGPDVG